jgi:hypothetical protein
MLWLKVVTFAVPQGGQNWFVLDCLPTAQSEAKNVSAGCTRKRRTDGDFRRFLPHPFVRQLPSYFATKPEMPSVRLFPSCSSPSPIVARHEFPTSRLLGSQRDLRCPIPHLWPRHNFRAESCYWGLAAVLIAFAGPLKLKLFFVILVASLVLFWVSSRVLQEKSQSQR